MLQMSKVIRSRNEWRNKAVQRATEIRELKKAKRRYQSRIAKLKAQIAKLERAAGEKTKLAAESKQTDSSCSASCFPRFPARTTAGLCVKIR